MSTMILHPVTGELIKTDSVGGGGYTSRIYHRVGRRKGRMDINAIIMNESLNLKRKSLRMAIKKGRLEILKP